MEQIPEIELFGFIIRVTWSDRSPSWAEKDARYGCYDPNTQRIWVCTKWAESEQRATLIHELLHVVVEARQVRPLLESEYVVENIEETVVERLGSALDDLLSRNPDFRALWDGD